MIIRKLAGRLILIITLNYLAIDGNLAQIDEAGKKNDSQDYELISYLDRKLDQVLEGIRILAIRQEDLSKQVQRLVAGEKQNSYDNTKLYKNNQELVDHDDSDQAYSDGNTIADADLERWLKLATTLMNEVSEYPIDDNFKNGQLNISRKDSRSPMISKGADIAFAKTIISLGTMLRSQINGLGKRMNQLVVRTLDQSQQIGSIFDHLSYVKDECALAASGYSSMRGLDDSPKKVAIEECKSVHEKPIPVVIRSSDISMMSSIIVQELSQRYKAHNTDTSVIENWREQLSDIIQHESEKLIAKLDILNLSIKQSTSHLSKLVKDIPVVDHALDRSSIDPIVLEFNNGNASSLSTNRSSPAGQSSNSRWFPGSKVPGAVKTSENDTGLQQKDQTTSQQQSHRCKSKTSLVKPTSCQMLRWAGANCTGKYYIFVGPSIRHVFCEMNLNDSDLGGGWTVIMRRLDKSLISSNDTNVNSRRPVNKLMESLKAQQVNFNQGWASYRAGFGQLDEWSEFFSGLDLLHNLTFSSQSANSSTPTNELQIDMETNNGHELHLRFSNFSVSNENEQYQMSVGKCDYILGSDSSSPCDPIHDLNGARFYIHGEPFNADLWSTNQMFTKEQSYWGWWTQNATSPTMNIGHDYFSAPTKPIGNLSTATTDGVRHLFWPNWPHSHEPIRRLVFKIRRDVRGAVQVST